MMIDDKGCTLLLVLLAIIGLIGGMAAVWLFGAAWWVPIAGAIGLPLAVLVGFFVLLGFDWLKGQIIP
jgi:hypothetical protein